MSRSRTGNDEAQDFGELLVRAQRDNGKVLVRDVQCDVTVRQELELEQKRGREMKIERRGPEIDRGISR